MPAKINLAIICGGPSGEHQVSLNSARQLIKALDKTKYNITPLVITRQGCWLSSGGAEKCLATGPARTDQPAGRDCLAGLEKLIRGKDKIDLVVPIGHGPLMEDGRLQGLLDILRLPYLFSGCLASALSMDKHKSKLIAREQGIKVAPDVLLNKKITYKLANIKKILAYPIIIKPNQLGSSVGMSIAKNDGQLRRGIEQGFKFCDDILLEQFIQGRELTVPIFGNNPAAALPVIEIIPKISSWFDYKAKYEIGGSDEICPAAIPDQTRNRLQAMAVAIFNRLDCRDLARADFILDSAGDIYFLEINTIPGLTATSLVPQSAKAAGLELNRLLDKLISNRLKSI
jgi:D-alanine-D-alanine ligase